MGLVRTRENFCVNQPEILCMVTLMVCGMPVLPSQSLDLAFHEWRNERRALLPPNPRFIVHRKQQSLAFTIARRQTDLDCPP